MVTVVGDPALVNMCVENHRLSKDDATEPKHVRSRTHVAVLLRLHRRQMHEDIVGV